MTRHVPYDAETKYGWVTVDKVTADGRILAAHGATLNGLVIHSALVALAKSGQTAEVVNSHWIIMKTITGMSTNLLYAIDGTSWTLWVEPDREGEAFSSPSLLAEYVSSVEDYMIGSMMKLQALEKNKNAGLSGDSASWTMERRIVWDDED